MEPVQPWSFRGMGSPLDVANAPYLDTSNVDSVHALVRIGDPRVPTSLWGVCSRGVSEGWVARWMWQMLPT
jgi:hypothetical protein